MFLMENVTSFLVIYASFIMNVLISTRKLPILLQLFRIEIAIYQSSCRFLFSISFHFSYMPAGPQWNIFNASIQKEDYPGCKNISLRVFSHRRPFWNKLIDNFMKLLFLLCTLKRQVFQSSQFNKVFVPFSCDTR